MALLNLSELINHSVEHDYQLLAINVQSLLVLKGAIVWAKKHDVPFVVTIDGAQVEKGLIPSIEELLRQEEVASSIIVRRISHKNQAVEALRRGCQAVFLNNNCNEQDKREIEKIANACGMMSQAEEFFANNFLEIEHLVEFGSVVKETEQVSTWHQLEEVVTNTVIKALSNMVEPLKAKGMAVDAKMKCKIYAPIEHLIIYNSSVNDEQTRQAGQMGARVLDKIPGVRATWRGESVKSDAKYRWCWLIRFANESVIASYREHPDHVAYANEQFRPIADDRISIDYVLFGPENSIQGSK
jgi:hypothetical protein